MISRLNIDGKTSKGDFLDLILALKNTKVSNVIVMRKGTDSDGRTSISAGVRDEYHRNNQGSWYMTKCRNMPMSQRIEAKYDCIVYV